MESSNEELLSRIERLEKSLEELNSDFQDVIFSNRKLKSTIDELNEDSEQLHEKIYYLECQHEDLNQYSRRNNIEIQNIPENIHQKDLELYVIKMLHTIHVYIHSYDVVAVHRLGKFSWNRPRSVIVRFLNRKTAYISLDNAKLLVRSQVREFQKLYITENLCPTYKKIFNRLYKLKKESKIENVWTYEGKVYCEVLKSGDDNNNNNHTFHIKHIDDIDYYLKRDDDWFSD